MTDNSRAALLMMGAMALFTMNDALIKLLAGEVDLFRILVIRNGISSVALGLMAWRAGAFARGMSRRDWGLSVIRAVGEVGAVYFYLTALWHMPLANVTAVLQSAPLVVTLAAALFLGEPVGWKRIGAVVVGFLGVLLIVRPGPEGFSIYALYTLIAVLFVTLRDLSTRQLSPAAPTMLVTATSSVSVFVFALLMSWTTEWTSISAQHWGILLTVSVLILGAYHLSVASMRQGEISFVSPFRYTGIIWALVLGYAMFGHWPTPLTLVGAAIVAGSGLFTLYRERRRGRRTAAVSELPIAAPPD